jgi:hypothetical protein
MKPAHLLLAAGLALAAGRADAFEAIFTGVVSSGVDAGGVFGPVGADLTGQLVAVKMGGPSNLDPGATSISTQALTNFITIGAVTYRASNNDIETAFTISPGVRSEMFAQTVQNFDTAYTGMLLHVNATRKFIPDTADLSSAFKYRPSPGEATASFFIHNEGSNYFFTPPDGGAGGVAPWADTFAFAFDRVYFNLPVSVPEPGAWAIMLVGLALTGARLRRSRGLASR